MLRRLLPCSVGLATPVDIDTVQLPCAVALSATKNEIVSWKKTKTIPGLNHGNDGRSETGRYPADQRRISISRESSQDMTAQR